MLAVVLYVVSVVVVRSVPSFNIAVFIQSTEWPGVETINKSIETDSVRLHVYSRHIDGSNKMAVPSTICNQMTYNSVDGVVVFVDCQTANILSKQLLFRQLVHTVVIKEFCDVKDLITAKPTCDMVNRVLSDVAGHKSWRKILLFHDNTLDLIMGFSKKSLSSRIVNVSNYIDDNHYIDFLTKYKHHTDAVIVIGATDTVEEIIRQATTHNISQDYWISMTGDKQLPIINSSNGNFIFLRQSAEELCSKPLIKNEYESYISESVWKLVSVFSTSVMQYNITSLESLSCQQKVVLQNRTRVMKVAKKVFRQNQNEFQVCSSLPNQRESFGHMGKWSPRSGLALQNGRLFGKDFVDFNNATLIVAALPLVPFVFFTKTGDITQYSGFCIDILDQLAMKFNFNYKIVSPADNSFGTLKDNGQWNGMEVDFAVGPFTITSARESVIDFTTTYMEDGAGIITKRPQEEQNKAFKVFKPLSVAVWGSIVAAIIITSLLYFVIIKLSPFNRNTDGNHGYKELTNAEILSSSSWLIYGSFVEQGGDPRPSSTSGRVMLSVWWIFTILVLSTYTANLAAILTVSIIDTPINSLEELANQDNIKPLIFSGANLHTLFQTASTDVYRSIWEKMDGVPNVNELDVALNYVKDGQFAFMTDFSVLDYIMLQDCTTYAMADDLFNNSGLGFVLQENATYLEAFNHAIMKLAEAGLIVKWQRRWWSRSDSCSTTDRSGSAQSLGMDSVLGLFYFYLIVVGIAIVLFIIELCFKSDTIQQRMMLFKTKGISKSIRVKQTESFKM